MKEEITKVLKNRNTLIAIGMLAFIYGFTYLVGTKVSFVWLMFLIYIAPLIVGGAILSNNIKNERNANLTVVFYSLLSVIMYGVFAYGMEHNPDYVKYASNTSHEVGGLSISVTTELFTANQMVGFFLVVASTLYITGLILRKRRKRDNEWN